MESTQRGRQRVLLVGHEATRTGAPAMLLQVARAAREEFALTFLLRRGGPLVTSCAALGPTLVVTSEAAARAQGEASRAVRLLTSEVLWPYQLRRAIRRVPRPIALVQNNTMANGTALRALRSLGCPVVTHVHETSEARGEFVSNADWDATLRYSDAFIAVSTAVRDDLCERSGVAPERVHWIPNFIARLPPAPSAEQRMRAKEELGVRGTTPLVVGCGSAHPVKGADRFGSVARLVVKSVPDVAFLWLDQTGETGADLVSPGRVVVTGTVERLLTAADVVVVPSRVESFSLIALEAAALGRPAVAFAGARGPVDVLGGDAELLAPQHDVPQLADRVCALLLDPQRAASIGAALRERAAQEYSASRRAPQILSLWRTVIGER